MVTIIPYNYYYRVGGQSTKVISKDCSPGQNQKSPRWQKPARGLGFRSSLFHCPTAFEQNKPGNHRTEKQNKPSSK